MRTVPRATTFYTKVDGANIFTVISNLFLLFPSIIAWDRERIFISVVFFVETWTSSLYHLCRAFEVCIFDYWVLHNFDFFFATSLIWLATVFLIRFSYEYRYWELVLNMIGLLAVAVIQAAWPGEHTGVAIFAVVSMGILLIYAIVYGIQHSGLLPYNWFFLCVGLTLLTLSTMLYTIQNYWLAARWIIHSLWHVMAGLGWAVLLYSREKRSVEWMADKEMIAVGGNVPIFRFILPMPILTKSE
jgi:Protein of unknown function (DUF3522)